MRFISNTLKLGKNNLFFLCILLVGIYALPIAEILVHPDTNLLTAERVMAKVWCVDGSKNGVAPQANGQCSGGSASTYTVPDNFGGCTGDSTLQITTTIYSSDFHGAHCTKPDGTNDSSWWNGGNYAKSNLGWSDSEFWTSGVFLIYITGMLLSFAGWALNGSIQFFIIGMGTHLSTGTPLGDSIVSSWGIIRDIINITFVFGMIYLAFMTIAKADTSKLKHGVVQIVIAALLINFSLFFAKAIIDFGNVAAVEVYSYMESVGHLKINQTGEDWAGYGISGFFMERLGLSKLFNADTLISAGPSPDLALGQDTGFGFSLLVSLTLLIATFVFFAGAILITIRFVTLAMLLILSPVAFAGAALPGVNTEEWSRWWWKSLVSNVLFAPAYFLLLFISMKAVNVTQMVQGVGGDTTGTIVGFFKGEGTTGSIAAFMNFVLVIGFLVGSLIISKRMGAMGASTVNAWGKSARMYGQRALGSATLGLGATIGRRTLGQIGVNASNNQKLLDQASGKGIRAFAARRQLAAARGLAGASFDARQVGGLGKNLGIGEGRSGGQQKVLEDIKNKEKAYGESLGTVGDDDPMVMTFKQQAEDAEHHLEEMKEKQKQEIADMNDAIKRARNDKNETLAKNLEAARDTKKESHAGAIKTEEKKIKAIKEKLDQEKNRRQVGRALTDAEAENPQYVQAEKDIKAAEKKIETATKRVLNAQTAEQKATAIAFIENQQKQIKKLKEGQDTIRSNYQGAAVGYAGVIDSYAKSKTWSWGTGRTRAMNKAAAKAIRDTKVKAKKEEKKEKDNHGAAAPAAAGGGGGGHGAAAGHGHP